MEHLTIEANGASFHVARTGAGRPLLLLHGWPEFWLSWEPVMKRLADRYTLIAPDLRGFGDSAKPAGPFGPADHAADMLALLDALGVARVGVIGHDVGGAAMQPLARTAPERLAGLFSSTSSIPASAPGWRRPTGSTRSGTSPSTRWRWRRAWSAQRATAAARSSRTSCAIGRTARRRST